MPTLSLLIIALGSLFIGVGSSVQEQIYKYKDENGQWQFTDRPPAEQAEPTRSIYSNGPPKHLSVNDYQSVLRKKFQPKTEIEKATLAVVTIKTNMGSGTRFGAGADPGYEHLRYRLSAGA